MSTATDKDASANQQGEAARDGQAISGAAAAAVSGSAAAAKTKIKSSKTKEKNPKLPSLSSRFDYIRPIVTTQRVRLGTTMAETAKAMLATREEIRRRLETRLQLDGQFEDREDIDPTTGKGKIKSFIPKNIRETPMPLNCSKLVKKDGHCAKAYSEITTTLGQAKAAHDAWKQAMAGFARQIADSEIKGRKELLMVQYSEATIGIAEGLVLVAKSQLHKNPEKL
ncbi:MAG: hypothetical protein GY874_05640, partial [Desulfobacteraceae bacterium]|nr:hypothetical protein [Desulfobacteraceae bacterium]